MPATLQSKGEKVLSVRLPENDIRRLKSTAAKHGVTIQDAVRTAVESWLANVQKTPIESLDSLQGSLKGGDDVDTLRRREREFEFAKDARWSR